MVSDRGLLACLASYANETPSLLNFISNSLIFLSLPSLNIFSDVVAARANATVLDAMKLMSEEGVSSVAVVDDENGGLLSAVSITDIGKVLSHPIYIYCFDINKAFSHVKVVVPSESKQILYTPLHQFISQIKVSSPHDFHVPFDRFPFGRNPMVQPMAPTNILVFLHSFGFTSSHHLF